MQPSIGRIVHYALSAADAAQINVRRDDFMAARDAPEFSLGTQAHIGNDVSVGDVVPLLVVRVWPGG